MYMSEIEIVREYRTAKYPKEQIKILADLNNTSPAEIRRVLGKHGALDPAREPVRKKSAPGPQLSFDDRVAMDLYQRGYRDKDIAEALGVSRPVISGWRFRRGLPCVAPYKQQLAPKPKV